MSSCKEKPNKERTDLKICSCCKEKILSEDYYYYGCPHCGELPKQN